MGTKNEALAAIASWSDDDIANFVICRTLNGFFEEYGPERATTLMQKMRGILTRLDDITDRPDVVDEMGPAWIRFVQQDPS